jgi:hypothetical protein
MQGPSQDPQAVALWGSIETLSRSFYDRVYQTACQFWATKPSGERLASWLQERVWSEREGAKMHAYVVVQMAEALDADSLFFLSQQTADEARHYQLLSACLAARGRSLEGYEPVPRWRAVFQEDYDAADTRDPVTLFSILHMGGEGPASATAKAAMEALMGTPDEDIARAYAQIFPDESNHWSTGRNALKRYATTVESLERSLRSLEAKAQHLLSGYKRLTAD